MAANASPSSSSSSPSAGTDAIALLTADHAEVRQLFKDYDQLVASDADGEQKQELAELICTLLSVHAQLEEEVFYPVAREALEGDELLLDEALVEHGSAEDLIAQIEEASPDEELYDARVRVLGEYVEHHVSEEEDAMFPKLRKANVDLDELGERLAVRRDELLPDIDEDEDAEAAR